MNPDEELRRFLHLVKTKNIDLIPRTENLEMHRYFGITRYDQIEFIRSVDCSDYYKGPLEDDGPGRTGLVWVFKKYYEDKEIYIKLKYKSDKDEITAISCHL